MVLILNFMLKLKYRFWNGVNWDMGVHCLALFLFVISINWRSTGYGRWQWKCWSGVRIPLKFIMLSKCKIRNVVQYRYFIKKKKKNPDHAKHFFNSSGKAHRWGEGVGRATSLCPHWPCLARTKRVTRMSARWHSQSPCPLDNLCVNAPCSSHSDLALSFCPTEFTRCQ